MNPNIAKRLDKEKEENKKPGEYFYIQPLPDDMYMWHFTLKGVPNSPYENGLFHGHFILPQNYPLNPPDIFFHNPNGRYSPHVKICLNITGYHKESWSPIWSLRKMMEAICAYFLCDEGGIGSIVMSTPERQKIAKESRNFKCDKCGPLVVFEQLMDSARNGTPQTVTVVTKIEAPVKVEEAKPVEEKAKGGKGKGKKAEKEPEKEPEALGKRGAKTAAKVPIKGGKKVKTK